MKTPISPKVSAGIFIGILASAVLANLQFITPDLFAFLGGWGQFGYGVVIVAATAGAGYLKRDLLRDVGAQTVADQTAAGDVASPYGVPVFPASPITPAAPGMPSDVPAAPPAATP